MGNNPSANSKSPTSTSTYEQSRNSLTRKDPRNFIHAQRSSGESAPAPARGATTVTHRVRSSSHTVPNHQPSTAIGSVLPSLSKDAQTSLKEELKLAAVVDEPSKPVDVPAPTTNAENNISRTFSPSIELSGPSSFKDISYYLTRPPRLPLPIEEEIHTPGSPTIAPVDIETPLDTKELENEILILASSALSNTTIDEEDAEELQVDRTKATVPITFEWRHGGDKVYVTGTIFQWDKKHRLHPVDGQPGVFRAVIHVRPGTHHIRFITDTILQCSPDLPTTVDFGNNLVNYIEVSADDIPQPNLDSHSRDPRHSPHPPTQANTQSFGAKTNSAVKSIKSRPVLSPDKYTSQIPRYIIDLDKPEDSVEYRNAAIAVEKLPTPPTLPGFLGKPILNVLTPIKDDNSVLTMPNHTVLNHLATSSIKNNVLAISATTRYRRKYVTTIMYKPTCNE
ncbi:hypothetical protein K3495_g2914 [Podosphaera aphanis]|nr:hypothetical protein K3495_g2914 [Podosphaera aphanis]